MIRTCGPWRRDANGFTLIEMLVALSLFAILSAAGVALLRGSVDTQSAVQDRLAQTGTINRLYAMLSSDIGQALPRTTRDASGASRPAFVGDANGFALVRSGAAASAERPAVQRISYRVDRDALIRGTQAALDGVDPAGGDAVLRDVARATFRYRRADGGWDTVWAARDTALLPRAIEMTVERTGQPAVTMIAAMPPAPPLVQQTAATDIQP